MPIWRVTVTDVKAKREDKLPQGMTVEVSPALEGASTEKAGDTELVRVDYRFRANYQPSAGSIEVAGSMYFIGLDAKKVLKDGKLVDTEVIRQAMQRIFVEPAVIAISLAKELLLPLPVKMPEVKVEEKK